MAISPLADHHKVFQLSSIDTAAAVPKVRSHIFRTFLGASSAPSLPLLVTTTDVRTPKVSQMITNPNVQLVWWIDGSQEQFRISGIASIVPRNDHPLYKHFLEYTKNAKEGTGIAALTKENYDWEESRNEVFKGLSAHMKASWVRPTPGSRLEGGEEEAKKWPVRLEEPKDGDEEGKRNWETALNNFGLVIIDPTEVDYVEFAVVPNRRTRFWKTEEAEWMEESLVP